MAAKGDALNYRSMAGILYPARLIGLNVSSGRCSIEVDVGAGDWFPVTMARWSERDDGKTFTAWPKEASGGKAESDRPVLSRRA